MKKFLSLVLALVMTFSLMTVAASAKTADLTDGSKIAYPEAVDVITTLKVMDGYTDGSFGPTNILTREQAAKIICVLAVGRDTADKLGTSTAPFKDVAADRWSAGYIAYCANAGIIDGYADGTFKPANTLTGYQFLKMLLGVVGYKSGVEGFTGTNWTVAVAKLAIQAGMVDGNASFVGSQGVTREEAALYAFNTLQADEVYYEQTGTSITVGGTTIVTGTSAAKKVEGSKDTIVDDSYMQFAEEHFPELKLSSPTNAKGEPSNKWVYKNVAIGTYAKTADIVFTAETSEKNIKAALDGIDCTNPKEVTWNGYTYTVDFSAIDSVAKLAAYMDEESVTADGRIVEIFNTSSKLYVVVLDTVVAQITKINTKDNEVTLSATYNKVAYTFVLDEDATGYDLVSGMKKGDYVLVVPDITSADKDGKYTAVLDAYKGTTATGKWTKKVSDDYTVGGTKYTANVNMNDYGKMSMNGSGTILLDKYGYMIALGIDSVDDVYAYVMNAARDGSAKTGYTYSMKLLFTDGKTEWVDVSKVEGDAVEDYVDDHGDLVSFVSGIAGKEIVSYTKAADGTYEVNFESTVVASGKIKKGTLDMFDNNDGELAAFATTTKDGVVTLDAGSEIAANSDTVFLVEGDTTGSFTVYTGIKNVPTTTGSFLVKVNSDKIAEIVVARNGDINNTSSDQVVFYNIDSTTSDLVNSGTGFIGTQKVAYYKAIVNGEKTTVAVDYNNQPVVWGLYYKPEYTTKSGETYISALGTHIVDSKSNDDITVYDASKTEKYEVSLSGGTLYVTEAGTDTKLGTSDDVVKTYVVGDNFKVSTLVYDKDGSGYKVTAEDGVAVGTEEDALNCTKGYIAVVQDDDNYATDLYVVSATAAFLA